MSAALPWELVGFVGFVTNVLGNLLLAWKYKSGWGIRLVPNVCWAAYSIHFTNVALLLNSVTFFIINVIGWWKWSRSARACRGCGSPKPGNPCQECGSDPRSPRKKP